MASITYDGVTYTEEEWALKAEAEIGKLCDEHQRVIKRGKYGNFCGGKDKYGRWCTGVVKK